MDQPHLDLQLHHEALRGLERINTLSGTVGHLWRPIQGVARKIVDRPARVLDIATGAGDLPIGIWHRAHRFGLRLDVAACDRSGPAVDFARRRAEQRRADVRFFQLDALTGELPSGYDILTCSLFLHHLEEDQATGLLRRMASAARRMVLISDLVRSSTGWTLARLGTRLLTNSPVVQTDGPRSVEGAFTVKEAGRLAHRAGLARVDLKRHWPCRFLLVWQRDEADLDA